MCCTVHAFCMDKQPKVWRAARAPWLGCGEAVQPQRAGCSAHSDQHHNPLRIRVVPDRRAQAWHDHASCQCPRRVSSIDQALLLRLLRHACQPLIRRVHIRRPAPVLQLCACSSQGCDLAASLKLQPVHSCPACCARACPSLQACTMLRCAIRRSDRDHTGDPADQATPAFAAEPPGAVGGLHKWQGLVSSSLPEEPASMFKLLATACSSRVSVVHCQPLGAAAGAGNRWQTPMARQSLA